MPFILDRIRDSWPQRQFVRNLLRRLEIDCVLDVGANIGQYGDELRLIGYTGLIVSFEPDPETYRRLVANVDSDPRRVAMNIALGAERGHVQLNVMASSDFNSFRRPTTNETTNFEPTNRIVGTVEVEMDTLNEILPDLMGRHGFTRPFLKMDTQGFDLEVFRGAANVHSRILGLQSELPIKHIYEDTTPWGEAIIEYQRAGFDLAGLYKVNPSHPDLVELDCYLTRSGSELR